MTPADAKQKIAFVNFTNVYDAVRFRCAVPVRWQATVEIAPDPCAD